MLEGNNSEMFLSNVSEYCPTKATFCGRSAGRTTRVKREASRETKFELDKVHSRKKRLFDPREMMRLFNRIICSREIVDKMAEYWDAHYGKFLYSRVWIMRVVSSIWCCAVNKLENSYGF